MQGYPAGTVGALRAGGINHLAGGISAAGHSIVQAIEKSQAESKRLKAFRAMAVDGLGMNPDEVDAMDADTLQGKLEAVAIRSQRQREQAQLEDQEYEQMQRTAGADFQARLNTGQPLTPQALMAAAQESGFQLPPQVLNQMMREGDATNWDEIMPRPFEIDGVRGAVGKSGQFQFLPTTPDSLPTIPVLDPDGNVLGYRVATGKGGTAAMPKSTPAKLPDSYNSRLSLLQDELKAATATAGKTDAELKQLKLSGTRDFYQKAAAAARQAIGDHVARFQEQGYADENFWTAEKQRLGLGESRKSKGEGQAGGRVTVADKDGNQFTVPAAQLEAAKKQGYTEVK